MCLLPVKSFITVGLSYQLINIIVGPMQCSASLGYLVYSGQCFSSVLLSAWPGAYGCLLRLCAVDFFMIIFLCSVITSQVTSTTTTPPVTVLCSGTSSLIMNVAMVPTLMPLSVILCQHNVVLTPVLMLRDTKEVLFSSPLCCSSILSPRCLLRQMPIMLWVLCRYSFSFRVEPPTCLNMYVGFCNGAYLLLSGAMLDAMFTHGSSTI